jgi:hypothetical protein
MTKPLKITLSDEPKLSVSAILFSINMCEKMGKSETKTLRILKESLSEKLEKYKPLNAKEPRGTGE